MTANRKPMPPDFDEIPDLSTPEWLEKFATVKVQRGRPKALTTKVSTTIRLSPDVLEHFKAGGPGWQSRINEALRKVVEVEKKSARELARLGGTEPDIVAPPRRRW